MSMSRVIFPIVILTAGVWSAFAFGDDAKALKGPEITALLSGNTVKGPNFSEYYDADGSVRGSETGSKYAGSWRIDADKLCTDFPSYNYKDCITVRSKNGAEYEFVGSDGTRTFTVVKGDPGNL